jgi:16S rRNA (guanine966-N2)-methyltransferase
VDVTRIVGGSAGGRRLVVPHGRGTRPTSERAREGLFSTLESIHHTLAGRAFLDLYAGSGAVGLEAASRGASPVLLVESGSAAVAALRANTTTIDLPQVEVRADRVDRILSQAAPHPFDVVFLDPPYADDVEPALKLLVANDWLAMDATVVVERASRSVEPGWPPGWTGDRARRYGDSTLWYGRRS